MWELDGPIPTWNSVVTPTRAAIGMARPFDPRTRRRRGHVVVPVSPAMLAMPTGKAHTAGGRKSFVKAPVVEPTGASKKSPAFIHAV
ncbi:hypothetical protein GCM10009785_29730 [Brooklawnia cerclae]